MYIYLQHMFMFYFDVFFFAVERNRLWLDPRYDDQCNLGDPSLEHDTLHRDSLLHGCSDFVHRYNHSLCLFRTTCNSRSEEQEIFDNGGIPIVHFILWSITSSSGVILWRTIL